LVARASSCTNEVKHEVSGDGKKVMEKIRLELFRSYFPAEVGETIAKDSSQPASTSEILSAK